MKYSELRNKVATYPIFSSNIFEHLTKSPAILRRQMTDWAHKKQVLTLKRGLYTLNDHDRRHSFSQYYLANQLCSPSYISLESALSYYGMIPEKTVTITSITSKKTQSYQNDFGLFTYQHVKPILFNNFISTKDEFDNTFFIATAERAIIDFLYLKTRWLTKFDADIFEVSYRLQNLKILNKKQLKKIAATFNNQKLNQLLTLLLSKIKNLA